MTQETFIPSTSDYEAEFPELYEHDQLDLQTDEIRLLVLEPGVSPIRCAFQKANLSNSPEYEALSYTWGDAEGQQTILLEGKRFKVRHNLYNFLYMVCNSHRPRRVLWIDALCINQSNIAERNHNVTRMGDIYRSASRVLCWLGQATPNTDAFLKEMRTTRLVAHPPSRVLHGMKELLFCDYWKRTWILQELVLARDIQILCGNVGNSWHDFRGKITDYLPLRTPDESLSARRALILCRDRYASRNLSLAQLLEEYGDSDCSEVCDRIYALLGIATDCHASHTLPVDYAMSKVGLLVNVLAFCDSPTTMFGSHVGRLLNVPFAIDTRGSGRLPEKWESWLTVPVPSPSKVSAILLAVGAIRVANIINLDPIITKNHTRGKITDFAYRTQCEPQTSRDQIRAPIQLLYWCDVSEGDIIYKVLDRHLAFVMRSSEPHGYLSLVGLGLLVGRNNKPKGFEIDLFAGYTSMIAHALGRHAVMIGGVDQDSHYPDTRPKSNAIAIDFEVSLPLLWFLARSKYVTTDLPLDDTKFEKGCACEVCRPGKGFTVEEGH